MKEYKVLNKFYKYLLIKYYNMFTDIQMKNIKILSSMTVITNKCFDKCVLNIEDYKLTKEEINCLQTCSESFLKLRNFIEQQLFEDYESIVRKNKKILEEQT
jgi:hypothetical protein